MKLHSIIPILIVSSFSISCNSNAKENEVKKSVDSGQNIDISNSKALIKEGYTVQSKEDFLSDNLLIAKKNKLKGYNSLNIKGHRLYKLDKRGNILEKHDISNNYSVYSYDKKNRLVKSENKQHTTDETYYKVIYKYSQTDSLIEISTTKYKDSKPTETVTKNKEISLHANDVRSKHFQNNRSSQVFFNPEKSELVTYEDEMIFCCGEIMKGKNKLTYYINEDELIDSLIIVGLEKGNRMKFIYEYE